jgi:hypothetical protein
MVGQKAREEKGEFERTAKEMSIVANTATVTHEKAASQDTSFVATVVPPEAQMNRHRPCLQRNPRLCELFQRFLKISNPTNPIQMANIRNAAGKP